MHHPDLAHYCRRRPAHYRTRHYIAIRIIGSVRRRLAATVLSLIPGCEPDAWMPDCAMPNEP
jgi:hypothetical protein